MNKPSVVSIVIGVVGLLAATVMGAILVTDDDDDQYSGVTEEGFVIEPASSVGPDAFTPSVEIDGEEVCDTGQFLEELASRPDAVREWARVLGLQESDVPGYVATLTPEVLTEDTPVTNHGLHDGVAYARPSLLEAGTAVLMGTLPGAGVPTAGPPTEVPPDTEPPETVPTTASTVPTTTTPGEEIPVTRCRCGNPLLGPYAPSGAEPVTTTSTTTTVVDVPPDDVVPPDVVVPPDEVVPPDQPVTPDPDSPDPDTPDPDTPDPDTPDPDTSDQGTPDY